MLLFYLSAMPINIISNIFIDLKLRISNLQVDEHFLGSAMNWLRFYVLIILNLFFFKHKLYEI